MKLKVKTGVIFTDKNMSKGIIYGHALFFFREKKNWRTFGVTGVTESRGGSFHQMTKHFFVRKSPHQKQNTGIAGA